MDNDATNPLCLIAPVQPPDGYTSNLVNPPSLANTAIAVCSIMIFWASVLMAGRLYVNFRKLAVADYVAIAAFIFDVAHAVVVILTRRWFRHEWDIPICWFTGEYMKIDFANSIIAPFAVGLSKTSVFLILLQIFSVKQSMRWAIYAGIAVNAIVYVPNLFVTGFLGAPHAGETWSDLVVNQRPADAKWLGTYQGPCAVLLDIYIFILPFPILKTLNMPRKLRLKLFILFGTALMGIVASVIACVYRFRLIVASGDDTWADAQVFLPIIVEDFVTLIVGCMPAFATFLRLHVANSTFYKKLRTHFTNYEDRDTNTKSGEPSYKKKIETVGGGGKKGRAQGIDQTIAEGGFPLGTSYYELRDTSLLTQTQATIQSPANPNNWQEGQGPNGITRMLEVDQSYDARSMV
ncbi:hypothetical protein M406DRAFT_357647, partial [Cryphonectria parasitica EP155]